MFAVDVLACPAGFEYACSGPAGYVDDIRDCNDLDPSVHPGSLEICDGIDNDCDPATGEPDLDLDRFPVCFDCDDSDGSRWEAPGEVRELTFWINRELLLWDPPDLRGGTQIDYDLLRSPSAADFHDVAVCLPTQGAASLDAEMPPRGAVWHYLVRATNGCPQAGTLGADSLGRPRSARVCP